MVKNGGNCVVQEFRESDSAISCNLENKNPSIYFLPFFSHTLFLYIIYQAGVEMFIAPYMQQKSDSPYRYVLKCLTLYI